jgi:hypothetical protein
MGCWPVGFSDTIHQLPRCGRTRVSAAVVMPHARTCVGGPRVAQNTVAVAFGAGTLMRQRPMVALTRWVSLSDTQRVHSLQALGAPEGVDPHG